MSRAFVELFSPRPVPPAAPIRFALVREARVALVPFAAVLFDRTRPPMYFSIDHATPILSRRLSCPRVNDKRNIIREAVPRRISMRQARVGINHDRD